MKVKTSQREVQVGKIIGVGQKFLSTIVYKINFVNKYDVEEKRRENRFTHKIMD